ncbi:MAG: domain nuclease [Sphingobacteriaceae bacterium]|jgi:predicted nucleic acid-binding protein|nr:domain nuclease [Sphingobacteriaceae bacterium]
MEIILVDTSVWINFFKGVDTPSSRYLKENLSNCLVATCSTIVQEVLQGVRSENQFQELKSFFLNLLHLPETSSLDIAIQGATLYRSMRKLGVTVRQPNDCLIACYAINHGIPLLHDDRDFELIERHSKLNIVRFQVNRLEEPNERVYGLKES